MFISTFSCSRISDSRTGLLKRVAPFGIVMHASDDSGMTWGKRPIHLVADFPNKDLGYPTAALRSDGSLFVVYYGQDVEGTTGIHAMTVRLP